MSFFLPQPLWARYASQRDLTTFISHRKAQCLDFHYDNDALLEKKRQSLNRKRPTSKKELLKWALFNVRILFVCSG